jgi:hypothetical protein
MAGPPVVRLTVPELRRLFNENYLARTLNGTYRTRPFGDQPLYKNPPNLDGRAPEPEGTISGLIEVVGGGNERVAVCHRLQRPDGTYGASGLPDPKMVYHDGIIYIEKRKEGRQPTDLKTPSLFTDRERDGQ